MSEVMIYELNLVLGLSEGTLKIDGTTTVTVP